MWPETSGDKGNPEFDERKREDCKWILVDFTGTRVREEQGGGQESDRPKDTTGGEKWLGPFCYGRRGQGDPPGGKNPDIFSECAFKTNDAPFVKIGVRQNFLWQLDYLGVIHDVCNQNVPRRTKGWQYVLKGHIGADAKMTITDESLHTDGEREE